MASGNMFSVSVSWKRQYGASGAFTWAYNGRQGRNPRLAKMANNYEVELSFIPGVIEPPRTNKKGEPQNAPPPEAGEVAKWLMVDGVGEKRKKWDVWGMCRKLYSRPKWQHYVYRMIPSLITGGSIQNIYQGYQRFAQVVKKDFISVMEAIRSPALEPETVRNKTKRGIADDPSKPLIESRTMIGAVWVRVNKVATKTKSPLPEGYYDKPVSTWRGQVPSFLR